MLKAQDVAMDVDAHRAYVNKKEVQLTGKEFDLLRVLLREVGNVVERDQLMRDVWGAEADSSTKKLDMHILGSAASLATT